MPLRHLSLASLLLGVWAVAWLGLGTGGCSPVEPENVLIDRDGDGLPDQVRVGDFDRDGVLEIDDIQDAMDALTDPGPKLLVVQPGTFQPPSAPASRPGRTHALLELRSFTTLQCAGPGRTVLRGGALTATQDYAVVSNDDHVVGNDQVWIQRCEIDGGAPASYSSPAFPKTRRIGVFLRRTRNSGVADSYVHDTVHTGLYTSNSSGDRFLRNLVEDVGGYGDSTVSWRQPCIYLFAFGGGTVLSDFQALDNTLRRCGHTGLNTRAADADAPGDVVRNLLWERNTVEDTLTGCISLRGVDGATVRELSCHRAGSIKLSRGYGSGYRFEGNDNANANVLIEDAVTTQLVGGQNGLDVGAWVDGLRLRRVRVEGTRDADGVALNRDCAWLQRPLRNAVIEDLTLRDCGRGGAVVSSLPGGLGDASERLTLQRIEIEALDQAKPLDTVHPAGIDFVGAHARLLLVDLTLSGATGPELRFGGALSNGTLRRVEIDSVDPGWMGAFFEAQVPACTPALEGRWITSRNGTSGTDCVFTAGTTGATPARCGCAGGAWGPIHWAASPGIEFASGVTHANVLLEDVSVKNARGVTGVHVGGALSAFSVRTILGADDSPATDLNQRSAADFDAATGFSVTGASCVGTQSGVPCIE
jgi:hypothetical protein